MTMSEPFETSSQLTLFAEAFPVSPTPPLVDGWAPTMSATSGRTSPDSFATLNPDGSWRKTCQGYSQVMLDGSLEPFSETWPRAGMTRNGTAYRLPPSAPLTDATACGSWRTPCAEEATHPGRRVTKPGQKYHLTTQVQEREMWPTPDSGAFNLTESPETVLARQATQKARGINGNGFGLRLATAAQLWPTPCAEDAKNVPYQKGKDGVTRYPMLLGAVAPERMWPTPTSRDHKDGSAQACAHVPTNGLLGRVVHQWSSPRASDAGKDRGSSAGWGLRNEIGGALNPTWVEWLMGYPLGWTACGASATPSSRRSRNGSRGASSRPTSHADAR
jgi:hypothetical protein